MREVPTMRRLVRADPDDFGGSFPGHLIIPRYYWVHIVILPLALGGLLLLSYRGHRPPPLRIRRVDPMLPCSRSRWRVVEARRRDEAEHGIETGRIAMTPEGGFAEIREQVGSR